MTTIQAGACPYAAMNIEKAFSTLLRGLPDDLDAYLATVNMHVSVANTNAVTHCHVLLLDGNGRPRVKDLAEFVAARVLEYAIPRKEIVTAQERDRKSNSTAAIASLKKKADCLFTDIVTSGEGGEVLLSILVQTFLRIPQLLCKMPLKTNPRVHYHGVDGIHAKYDQSKETLALYWGESKLHKSVQDAVKDCLTSVSQYLLGDGGSADQKERDLCLITGNLDLMDNELESALIKYLDKDNPLYNKLEYRAVCLVGFDDKSYPSEPHSKKIADVLNDINKLTTNWNKSVGNKIEQIQNLNKFDMHIFLLPFPSVEEFRKAFLFELGYK